MEGTMKCDNISRAVLMALVVAAALPTQAIPVQGRRLPTFEVDRAMHLELSRHRAVCGNSDCADLYV